jgi:nuclear cap-binding protein subunit 1
VFINGVLDKEIRLSFAKRIRDSLPAEPEKFRMLIPESKDKDKPDFKYSSDRRLIRYIPA